MNKSELTITINASREETWKILFDQYGDIHLHNPTMISSNYMHEASIGELDSKRHVEFSDKLYLEEKISEVDELNSFTVVSTEHNLPFLNTMSATYTLSAIEDEVTELKMTSFNSTSPGFMIYLMRGQLRRSLAKHLFGLKYYIETGKTVDKDTYSEVLKGYT